MADLSLTVIYRTGGTLNCTWRACLPSGNERKADEQAARLERAGWKARIMRSADLAERGLPVAWDA